MKFDCPLMDDMSGHTGEQIRSHGCSVTRNDSLTLKTSNQIALGHIMVIWGKSYMRELNASFSFGS